MHISPKIYFCRILLFTERILLHQITNVSPAGDKLGHLLTNRVSLAGDKVTRSKGVQQVAAPWHLSCSSKTVIDEKENSGK